MENQYYVYTHRKLTDNQIFYVGKGKEKRSHSQLDRNKYWHNTVNKHGYKVEIIKDGISELESFELEKETILSLKANGIKLCNLTDGGDGISGFKFSESSKLKMSIAKAGHISPRKGCALSQEQKNNHSLFMIGKNYSSDKKIYHFVNISGDFFIGSRHDFKHKHNICTGNIWCIVNENRCLNGWALNGYDFTVNLKSISKSGINNPFFGKNGDGSHRANKAVLTVKKCDEIFKGTFFDFAEKFNINRKFASEFFKGRKKSCYGWVIATP